MNDPVLLSTSAKWRRVRRIVLDPTVTITIVVAVLSALQTMPTELQPLLQRHPLIVGVLTVVLSLLATTLKVVDLALSAPPPDTDSGSQ